jgi:hypothetical protein
MSFTAEELMTMQDEAERELAASLEVGTKVEDSAKESEVKEGDDKGGEAKSEEGKEGDSKEGGDPKKEEGEVKKDEPVKPEEKKEAIQDDEEVRELREIARAQKAELNKVTSEYERLNKILKDKGLIDEDDEKSRKDQEDVARVNYERRLSTLGDMLEVMKVNPRYEDIETVVSQRNFDDMITALAKYHVSQKGGDFTQTMTEVEREIWSLPNPYKYMYDLVKKYHPAYTEQEEKPKAKVDIEKIDLKAALKDAKIEDKPEKADEKKPKEQAMSLQDLPGGSGKDGGGWTSAKIDNMDEEDLTKVPRDIYERYLKNDLP